MNEEQLRQLFKDRSDCYADTWEIMDCETHIEGEVIQAMTEDRFVEIMNEIKSIL